MKIKFDPNQQYQIDAVGAVVGVFDGQRLKFHGRVPNSKMNNFMIRMILS